MTNHGWMCPACGSGCAPFCLQCPCVSQAKAAGTAVGIEQVYKSPTKYGGTVHGLYEYSVRGQRDAGFCGDAVNRRQDTGNPVPSDSPVPPSKEIAPKYCVECGLNLPGHFDFCAGSSMPNYCSECGNSYPGHFSHCSKSTPFTLG